MIKPDLEKHVIQVFTEQVDITKHLVIVIWKPKHHMIKFWQLYQVTGKTVSYILPEEFPKH